MKKFLTLTLAVLMAALMLVGCGAEAVSSAAASSVPEGEAALTDGVTIEDSLGNQVTLTSWDRVVSLYGSYAEAWVQAGGTLVGTTSDAIKDRGLEVGEDVAIVGSVKEPNMEEIIAAEPDLVLMSADVAEHLDFKPALDEAQIPYLYFRCDTFEEYREMMRIFTGLTGREDLYQQKALDVQAQIEAVLDAVEGQPQPTALLIRAFSTGAKAKGDDNLAGVILRDLGALNLVEQHESLLEDVSMEEIIAADPDFIFVVTMGKSEEKALAYLADNLESNPAWSGLTAVQNGNYILLPKDLFHFKPNARWGESYEVLAKYLYPDIADQIG